MAENWYDSGPGAEERDRQREAEELRKRASYRFGLPTNSQAEVTLISNEMIFYDEHSSSGKEKPYWNHSCLANRVKKEGDAEIICPFCVANAKKNFMLYVGTIINHTGYKNKDGKIITNIKQPLILKSTAKAEFLLARKEFRKKHGENADLTWTVWNLRRGPDARSLSTGDHFDIKSRRPRDKLLAYLQASGSDRTLAEWDEWLKPLSLDFLAPMSEAEACRFLGVPFNRPGSEQDVPEQYNDLPASDGSFDEPIPFDEEDEL